MKLSKRQFALVLVLLTLQLGVVAQSLSLRVMSYNVQQPFGTNWDGRRAGGATLINNEQADVIGTQEAVNYQRDYLINNTSGYSWYGLGRDGGDAGEGSWIFYKTSKYTLDAANSGNFWMSNTPTIPSSFEGSYNRICTYVHLVDNSTGQGFYVFNAHFPTPDLYNGRLSSMQLLATRVANRAVSSDPVYITGDFNSSEGDGVTIWMKSGNDNPVQCRDTYRDIDPTGSVTTGFGTKFDYVYCPDDPAYTTMNSWVVTSPAGVSDHMPIAADVVWGSGTIASIALSQSGDIVEGAEDGQGFTVTVLGDELVGSLSFNQWSVSNLPSGVTVSSISRTDATHAEVTLAGNSTLGSYSSSITDVSVTVDASQFVDAENNASANSGLLFKMAPQNIPRKIEAESFSDMDGVQLETTTDLGNGQNVGFLDNGDWLEYDLSVAEGGDFDVDFRTASMTNGGAFEVFVDGVLIKTVSFNATGGWQDWETTSSTLSLSTGTHTLRLVVSQDGFNVNWIDFQASVQTGGGNFQVKALSVNLWRKSNDWTTRMGNVVSMVVGESPDVVGLQEGDEGKQAELATAVAGYSLETGPWNDGSTSIMYNTSTVSIVETGTFGYSSQPDNQGFSDWGDGAANGWLRVCNWVLFEKISGGDRFYVYNNHLDANGFTPDAGYWRSQEVRLLADRISTRDHLEYPFIVIGDLNGVETEEAIQYLKTGTDNPVKMVDTYREILPDGPGDSFGSVKYDYILVADDANVVTQDASILYHSDYGWTSDHNQVMATIGFGSGINTPPAISSVSQSPVSVGDNEEVTVTADVVDDSVVSSVTLHWGLASGVYTNSSALSNIGGNTYSGPIAGQVVGTTVYYQIEAVDGHGATSLSTEYSYTVTDGESWLLADYDNLDLTFDGFSGSYFLEETNPNVSTGNPSAQVGSTVQGTENWSGIYSANLSNKVDFTTYPIFAMKVYGPKQGEVLVKFENSANTNEFTELTYDLTDINTWVQINLDFTAAPSNVYDRVVLFFDFGNNAQDTYYFDDLTLTASLITSNFTEALESREGVYPNPTEGMVHLPSLDGYTVLSSNGEVLKKGMGSELDLSALPAGMYWVKTGLEMYKVSKL